MAKLGEFEVGDVLTHRQTRSRWRVVGMDKTHTKLERLPKRNQPTVSLEVEHHRIYTNWRHYMKGDE